MGGRLGGGAGAGRLLGLPALARPDARLKHRYIECFPATDDPYDVLLDDFEPGMQTDEVRRVFDRLAPALRELVDAGDGDEEEPFVSGPYARDEQHELSVVVARVRRRREQLPARPDGPTPSACRSRRGTSG